MAVQMTQLPPNMPQMGMNMPPMHPIGMTGMMPPMGMPPQIGGIGYPMGAGKMMPPQMGGMPLGPIGYPQQNEGKKKLAQAIKDKNQISSM